MDYRNLFEKFDGEGKLLLPDVEVLFAAIPWLKHPSFEGVELKHIITSERTDGRPLLIGLSGYISSASPNGTSAPEGIEVFWWITPEEDL